MKIKNIGNVFADEICYIIRQACNIIRREISLILAVLFIVVCNYIISDISGYIWRILALAVLCIVMLYIRNVVYKLSGKDENGIPVRNRRFTATDKDGFIVLKPDDYLEAVQYLYEMEQYLDGKDRERKKKVLL